MSCNSAKLPLLLERVGERRIKSTGYIPTHPSLLPQGRRGTHLCIYPCPLGGVIKSTVFLEDYHKPLSFLSIGIDKTHHPGRDCQDPDAMDGNLNQVTSLHRLMWFLEDVIGLLKVEPH
jgi:hypothetical protein